MEKLSRKELLEYIERQDIKNAEYRKRFRDLVTAYKGLQIEKSALESSLKALNSSDSSQHIPRISGEECPGAEEQPDSIKEQDHPLTEDHDGSVSFPKSRTEVSEPDRVIALSKALNTLTQEKNRNESSLLADKKKFMQEVDDLKNQLEDRQQTFDREKATLQKLIQQLQNDLGKEQRQRQEDHNQHSLMMRELQAKLISERANRERLEQQYESLVWQQKGAKSTAGSQQRSVEDYERMLEDLTKEMSRLRKMHEDAVEKSCRPNPVLMELQNEMKDIKIKHQEAVADEQRLSNHAKEELRWLALSSEGRITSLEAKVTELSQIVGNYDRLRTQDQTNIQKLKERIVQLDLEKNALLQQQQTLPTTRGGDKYEQEDSNLDIHALANKITKLKGLLHLANQRSQKPLDPNVLMQLEEPECGEGDFRHARCKEELQQLKEEFEHYKARAQTVLRTKTAKDQESHSEVDSLRHQVSELKGRVKSCRAQCDRQIKALEGRLETIQQEHKQELRLLRQQLECEHRVALQELEQAMQRQRERTLALLEEKDQDLAHKDAQLQQFRTTIGTGNEQFSAHFLKEKSLEAQEDSLESFLKTSENLPEMLSQAMTNSNGDHLILHYVQDIARKDLEIGNLRRIRHQAETTLRELQRDSLIKKECYTDDLEAMQAKIFRLESSQSEEGINMEYLKNVVLRYILCKDVEGKRRILNAIAAILHFTVRELEQARMVL